MSYNNNSRYVATKQSQCNERRVLRDYPCIFQPVDHTRYFITSSYPEDDNEEFSVKQQAFIRFQRNHMLIKHIFSEVMVPDVRYVTSSAKLKTLKKQAENLIEYQKKMNAELQLEKEKYEEKKRMYLESDMQFKKKMEKFQNSTKGVDDETYQQMVEEQYNILKSGQSSVQTYDDEMFQQMVEEQYMSLKRAQKSNIRNEYQYPPSISFQSPSVLRAWTSQ